MHSRWGAGKPTCSARHALSERRPRRRLRTRSVCGRYSTGTSSRCKRPYARSDARRPGTAWPYGTSSLRGSTLSQTSSPCSLLPRYPSKASDRSPFVTHCPYQRCVSSSPSGVRNSIHTCGLRSPLRSRGHKQWLIHCQLGRKRRSSLWRLWASPVPVGSLPS